MASEGLPPDMGMSLTPTPTAYAVEPHDARGRYPC